MKRLRSTGRVALLLTVLTAATFGPAPAADAVTSQLYCTLAAQVTFTPGLSLTPKAQTFSGSGPVACVRKPANAYAGTISITGTTSPLDVCATGAGSGTFSMSLAGAPSLNVTGRFTFLRAGLAIDGPITLTGNDSGFGNLDVTLVPLPGQNCAQTSLKNATMTGTATAKGTIQ